jgi:hypothetical protein
VTIQIADPLAVPSVYPTIQSAINAASSAATIKVAAGTYYENLTWSGKSLTIVGAGAGTTIVDGGHTAAVLKVINVPASASIRGFTFTHGEADFSVGWALFGGGLLLQNSPITLADSVVTGNHAGTGSTCGGPCGGGGAGIALFGSNATIVRTTVSNNTALNEGGGVDAQQSSPLLLDDVITNNFPSGVMSFNSNGIANNTVGPVIVNTLVVGDNGSGPSQSGVAIWGSGLTLINTTVTGSTGYGVVEADPPLNTVAITNSIVWGNSSGDLIGRSGGNDAASGATVTYSTVSTGMFTPGTGTTSSNPLFVNAGAGNYRLQGASPAVDTGHDAAVPAYATTDLDGGARIVGAAVDMGAYEASSTPFNITALLNADVVINSSGQSGNAIDGSNYAYMTASRAAARGVGSGAGLPDNGTFPADGNHPAVQLYSVDASEGNNVRLSVAGQSYTIPVPNRQYAQAQLFAVCTEGAATMTFTLHYSDASTDTRVMVVPDWTSGGPGSDEFYLTSGLARESNGDHAVQSVNASIFGLNLNPNPAKTLVSIDVANPGSGNQRFVLFAAGGQ